MRHHVWIRTAVAAAMVGGSVQQSHADVFTNVPEAAGYQLVYQLPIANNNNFSGSVPYTVNNAGSIANNSYSRVGYYLELQTAAQQVPQYVYASFDAASFSRQANRLGVPTVGSGEFYQQIVQHMNVVSNAPGIVTGSNIATGNVEFWPSDYSQGNSHAIPNASGSVYDFGDTPSSGQGYGSMQIHNYGASQTLFAFNHWNDGSTSDLGIGNRQGGVGTDTDWTFAANAGSFTVKNLQIVVGGAALPPPPPSTRIMPLGDSITDGVGAPGGYRLPLQGKLNAVNINPDFVGSQNDNSGGLTDPEHEGHSGYTIAGIKGLPITDRITTYQPDVTLLMIGTNDISSANAASIPSLLSQLDDLISTIEGITLTNGQHTKLIVAQIVPRVGDNTLTQMYNDGIPALIAAHQALGQPVSMVDMFHALNPDSSDFADALHPNASGYDKMATVWTAGIQAVVPEPTTPMLLGAIGFFFAGFRRRRRAAV